MLLLHQCQLAGLHFRLKALTVYAAAMQRLSLCQMERRQVRAEQNGCGMGDA